MRRVSGESIRQRSTKRSVKVRLNWYSWSFEDDEGSLRRYVWQSQVRESMM